MANAERTKLDQIAELATPSGQRAWGGIGGSGKHAAEMVAELESMVKSAEVRDMLNGGRVAWGGIGGSGKHAAELDPEVTQGK